VPKALKRGNYTKKSRGGTDECRKLLGRDGVAGIYGGYLGRQGRFITVS